MNLTPQNSTTNPTDAEPPQTRAWRILLVEDERLVALSLTRQLQALGYEVVGQAAEGRAAIAQAGQLRPDLVLMDIHLEGDMDGITAAGEIQRRFQLPFIYLTAYSTPDVLDRAKVTEPIGYILKPFEERNLQVVIETALYRFQAERARLANPDADAGPTHTPRNGTRAPASLAQLSTREAEVMELIVAGKSQKRIAAELGISIQTTGKHRAKIYEKLGVLNDVELVRLVLSDQQDPA